jgi:hypothetical protein
MNYKKIISYIYALLAVGYGTFFCITYIYINIKILREYNYLKTTFAIIKKNTCYDKNDCDSYIEYTVNNIKYSNVIITSNNFKVGDKVEIKYTPNNPNEIYFYGNYHIYAFIYIILLIIFILLLWIFIFIIIIFPNIYIFLIYAIIATILISYYIYYIIYNHYYNIEYYYRYSYKHHTTGIIKSHDFCDKIDYDDDNILCNTNIEYLIDDVKYNVKIITFYYKVGENVKVYYNENNHKDIRIYDKNINKRLIKLFIYLFILILLWFVLIFYIYLIFKNTYNKRFLKKIQNNP